MMKKKVQLQLTGFELANSEVRKILYSVFTNSQYASVGAIVV